MLDVREKHADNLKLLNFKENDVEHGDDKPRAENTSKRTLVLYDTLSYDFVDLRLDRHANSSKKPDMAYPSLFLRIIVTGLPPKTADRVGTLTEPPLDVA